MTEERDNTNANPRPTDEEHASEDPAATHPTRDEDRKKSKRDDAVDESSEDSFPSSDAPSW